MSSLFKNILFRAKRKDNEEWVEGFYFCMVHDDGRHIHHFILPLGADLSIGTPIEKIQVEVYHVTVCTYTGLTDENGRRYEGDIFQADDGENMQRYIIAWNEDSLEWTAECITDPEGTLSLSEFKVSEIEVIGNIFDNPELLEGGAE